MKEPATSSVKLSNNKDIGTTHLARDLAHFTQYERESESQLLFWQVNEIEIKSELLFRSVVLLSSLLVVQNMIQP